MVDQELKQRELAARERWANLEEARRKAAERKRQAEYKVKKRELDITERRAKTEEREVTAREPLWRIEAFERQSRLIKWGVKGAGIFLLYYIIVGPGIIGMLETLLAIQWYWWILTIFILVIMIRRRMS